jgi:hypothetical protein
MQEGEHGGTDSTPINGAEAGPLIIPHDVLFGIGASVIRDVARGSTAVAAPAAFQQ